MDLTCEALTMNGMTVENSSQRWGRASWTIGAAMIVTALVAKQFVGEPTRSTN